jgi:hypothetical protein
MPGQNLARGTPAFREVLEDYVKWIAAKARAADKGDPNKKVWTMLQARAAKMAEA